MEKLADVGQNLYLGSSIAIPKFSGETWKLVTAWLQNFDLVARANDWTNAKKAKEIPMYLEGCALSLYLSRLNKKIGRAWARDWSTIEPDL